ncbi:MAG: YgfZ/GcvT domain-containing protein [Streptomycetales bacterium]
MTYASPLLDLPRAVPADPPDTGVAAHYGQPLIEQRRLAEGKGFVDLSHRGVVRVAGPDRLSWLHSLTSQHLTDLPPGGATEALVLSPHGHVEHVLAVVDDGEATWMHLEPGTAGALVAFLDSMRFMLRVEVADVTAERAVGWLPADAGAATGAPDAPVRRTEHGSDVFLPRAELAAFADVLGDPAGVWAYEALRIAAWRPRLGFETDHRTIPHEVGWLDSAVHLDKGCYRGQETVARVHNLGRPPRRLVFLHLDGSDDVLPPHGAPVELDDRRVGFVTSSARHYELGPIGLALVKRNTPVGATLLAGGVAAAQEVVVAA